MNDETRTRLQAAAGRIRAGILRATHVAGSGHPGGSLSAADVLAYLYEIQMRVDPANPRDPGRDRFVLSKGHAAPALYAALACRGFFPETELETLRQPGSRLQGHPSMVTTPGVDMSTGSLGQGASAAAGMALASRLSGHPYRVYVLVGDGEAQEGQIWEMAMFAAGNGLDNLCVILDLNELQLTGRVRNTGSLASRFAAFGFDTVEASGHDFDALEAAFGRFERNAGTGRPTAVLLHTVKGKGVSFMEGQAGWHGKAPDEVQFRQAMDQIAREVQA